MEYAIVIVFSYSHLLYNKIRIINTIKYFCVLCYSLFRLYTSWKGLNSSFKALSSLIDSFSEEDSKQIDDLFFVDLSSNNVSCNSHNLKVPSSCISQPLQNFTHTNQPWVVLSTKQPLAVSSISYCYKSLAEASTNINKPLTALSALFSPSLTTTSTYVSQSLAAINIGQLLTTSSNCISHSFTATDYTRQPIAATSDYISQSLQTSPVFINQPLEGTSVSTNNMTEYSSNTRNTFTVSSEPIAASVCTMSISSLRTNDNSSAENSHHISSSGNDFLRNLC